MLSSHLTKVSEVVSIIINQMISSYESALIIITSKYLMFVATFQQVSSDKFKADKNGEMPFIGKLVAGKAKATLVNGSVFKTQNYIPNRLYACQNVTTTLEDGRTVQNVDIIAEVSVTELPALTSQLGAPMLNLVTVETPEEEPAAQA